MNPGKSSLASLTVVTFALMLICVADTWAQTLKVLHNFGGPGDGAYPAEIVFDNHGNLFGATQSGGVPNCFGYGCGLVFELTPNADGTWSESLLYAFQGGNDGGFPPARVVVDGRGNVYGTVTCVIQDCNFGGDVFGLTQQADGTWREHILHTFLGGADGNCVYFCDVVLDHSGHLYGMTSSGGTNGAGVVFSISPGSVTGETVLHSFGLDEGGGPPNGTLIFDGSGNIYGTTVYGGLYGAGVVFKLTRNQLASDWTETVLYAFTGGSDGNIPSGALVFDSQGNLYGLAGGGVHNDGVAFKLTPNPDGTWTQSVIYDFPGGTIPSDTGGELIFNPVGDLYGGQAIVPFSPGDIYKLTPSQQGQWTFSVVYGFSGGRDGAFPHSFLLDSAGNIYGVTTQGGAYGGGVVFEITP